MGMRMFKEQVLEKPKKLWQKICSWSLEDLSSSVPLSPPLASWDVGINPEEGPDLCKGEPTIDPFFPMKPVFGMLRKNSEEIRRVIRKKLQDLPSFAMLMWCLQSLVNSFLKLMYNYWLGLFAHTVQYRYLWFNQICYGYIFLSYEICSVK